MANIETARGIRRHINGFRVLIATTLVAGATSGIAIKSEVDFFNSPEQKAHGQLLKQIQTLNTELSASGTLGSDGRLLFSQLEVRVPDDPRLKELGQLKNQYDAKTAEIQSEINSLPLKKARLPAAIGGSMLTLFGLMAILSRKKENKKLLDQA